MYYPAGGYLGLYFELFGITPTPGGSGFVDTISHRRTGASTSAVLVEAFGYGLKIGICAAQSFISVDASQWVATRRSIGKSYADLRPYTSMSMPTTGSTEMSDEETALFEHYMASLKD
jgi:hypothetical protein